VAHKGMARSWQAESEITAIRRASSEDLA
jgi:hypothetical protein